MNKYQRESEKGQWRGEGGEVWGKERVRGAFSESKASIFILYKF